MYVLCIYVYICTYERIYGCIYVCIGYMNMYMCKYLFICAQVSIFMYISAHTHIYLYTYICIYFIYISCEILRGLMQVQRGTEYPTYIKKKEG